MEPIEKSESAISTNTGEQSPPSKASSIERAAIGKDEAKILNRWLAQLSASSTRFIAVTKSDLINFLIRTHKVDLTPKEVSQIRSHNYNPVRHMNWIAQELKDALSRNDLARVAALQAEIKGIELSLISEHKAIINSDSSTATSSIPKSKRIRSKNVNPHNDMKRPSGADLEDNLSDE